MLRDLLGQIEDHVETTRSFKRTIAPKGEHVVVEYEVRKTFDVLLESLLRSLHDIAGLTRNLCEREAVPND